MRAPQTDWAPIQINQTGAFSETLDSVKNALNKQNGKLNLTNFHITLVGGGIIDRNQVLCYGDKLIAIPILSHSVVKKHVSSQK